MSLNDSIQDPIEWAIIRRLARLATMPVNTARLEQAFLSTTARVHGWYWRWFCSSTAIAAGVLVIIAVGLALLPSRTAIASPSELTQIHRDIVAGKIPTVQVESIDEANKAIAAIAGEFPTLPTPPAGHKMACCIRSIGNKNVACVLLQNGGVPVTMAVADAAPVATSKSVIRERDGQRYHVQNVGELNMVVIERQGRWVCLIGEVPVDKLIAVAAELMF
jgi:hypothetical protein